ncbi:cyclic nucleotide-binding domain-containing protein [uncultured Roseobacter sp.]|uniref:cyclic nucleotide-binding domain-containing protein n=1 Tax=uncultured Roseobacter sp. TaxID=114847 RepID=UPI0026306A87|nr:cyclic nucleotide-binding domain-containing protein [uncultured Roseobacter sp.]
MEEAHFQALMRGSYVQNFPPQIELIEEGDPSDFLHIVLSGSVELFSSWNRQETSMATVRPVSTFILAATIRDAPYLMSARTLEKSRIALIPSQDVRGVFDIDAKFARAIVAELAQCYRSVVKNTKDLKLRTSLERLAIIFCANRNIPIWHLISSSDWKNAGLRPRSGWRLKT